MDAKQDNNRSPEILGEMDADKGMAASLGQAAVRFRRSRRFLGLLTSGFIALSAQK
jgi:hypothetical protein